MRLGKPTREIIVAFAERELSSQPLKAWEALPIVVRLVVLTSGATFAPCHSPGAEEVENAAHTTCGAAVSEGSLQARLEQLAFRRANANSSR
jgi:hypothetical protein